MNYGRLFYSCVMCKNTSRTNLNVANSSVVVALSVPLNIIFLLEPDTYMLLEGRPNNYL